MAGINHLREVYEKKGEEFLTGLLNGYVIISEKIDGTFFGVKKKEDGTFKYFKKSGEITYVDRVLMKYYESAISYLEGLSDEKKKRIPTNFYFGFEYFTRGDSSKAKYSRLPKNGLVLSYIHKLKEKGEIERTAQDKDLLDRWADYLGVEKPPIIFEGDLNSEQKSEVLEFVYTNKAELEKKFKTRSFTRHILTVLGKEDYSSFLKGEKDGDISEIVFRFYDRSEEGKKYDSFLAKLVDPIFQDREDRPKQEKTTSSQDYIWLILIDLMNFFESYDVKDLQAKVDHEKGFDENYLTLINFIFKDFIKEYSRKYEGLQLDIPEYLQRPEFELDQTRITDPEVNKIITNSEVNREVYKILLNFFRKTRKRSSAGFFTPGMVTQLNIIVAKIRGMLMGDPIYESFLPSFNEYFGGESGILSEKEHAESAMSRVEPTEVNVLIGSFQPITMGHIKAATKMRDKNGKPCVLVAIKPEKTSKRSPFSVRQTRLMLEKVQQEYHDLIIDVRLIPSGQIEDVLDAIKPNYEPLMWGTSEKRIKDHAVQLDHAKKRRVPLRLSSNMKIVEIPSFVKSEEVISTIERSSFDEFKKLVPNSISSEFFNLQRELTAAKDSSPTKVFEGLRASADIVDESSEK